MSGAHFYTGLPDHHFWSRAVGGVAPDRIAPAPRARFRIGPSDRVATAGSCFAQHIARHLRAGGFAYYIAEAAHPIAEFVPGLAERLNYGTFSARFGNIYTTRQLVQLFDRAHGRFAPKEQDWQDEEGKWHDPFRPAIQPGGFESRVELEADRGQHLAAVRRMFAELDVFVFTLGLTEAWMSREDGAVFPLCPGVKAGQFDPGKYAFHNLTVTEVADDLDAILARLSEVNPGARVVLTVSPVPLAATAEDRHVLVSTVASKSILRAAVDVVERNHDHVVYFPSYEIITSAANAHRYYAPGLRDVTEEGVGHVMRVFFDTMTEGGETHPPKARPATVPDDPGVLDRIVQVICDEEALDR